MIMGKGYTNYKDGLKELKMETLEERRTMLSLRFAKKCLKSEKYKHWFQPVLHTNQVLKTRSVKPSGLIPVQARTQAFEKSPIAYLTRLINGSM